jgi:segregation and condensation protein B
MRRGRADLATWFLRPSGSLRNDTGRLDYPPSWEQPGQRQSVRQPPSHDPQRRRSVVADEPCLHRRTEEQARLEAALFLAREPLPTRRLAKLARLSDGTRATAVIRELNAAYDADGSAFRAEWIAGGFQLLSRAPFGPWLRRLLESAPENRLSAAAMETLAIVAYRQPATRADIEAIRGVGSDEMLRHLLERELIAIGGRSDELGRPNVYITTRLFLQVFGLGHLDELPPVDLPAERDHTGDADDRSDPEADSELASDDTKRGGES